MNKKTTLKIDGKAFSAKRLGKALADLQLTGDISIVDFLEDLRVEAEKALKEEDELQ